MRRTLRHKSFGPNLSGQIFRAKSFGPNLSGQIFRAKSFGVDAGGPSRYMHYGADLSLQLAGA